MYIHVHDSRLFCVGAYISLLRCIQHNRVKIELLEKVITKNFMSLVKALYYLAFFSTVSYKHTQSHSVDKKISIISHPQISTRQCNFFTWEMWDNVVGWFTGGSEAVSLCNCIRIKNTGFFASMMLHSPYDPWLYAGNGVGLRLQED